MVYLLDVMASFSIGALTLASGFVGLFLFLLMILTGWIEREQRPIRSKILIIGGMAFSIVWLWVQILSQFRGVHG